MELTPSQKRAYDSLAHAMESSRIVILWGAHGMGKTTILRQMSSVSTGPLLGLPELVDAGCKRHALQFDEAVYEAVKSALTSQECVFVDNVDALLSVSGSRLNPRHGFFELVFGALAEIALESQRHLVLAAEYRIPRALQTISHSARIERFGADDLLLLFAQYLPYDRVRGLDADKILRFAPKINGHQVRLVCARLASERAVTADAVIDVLRQSRIASAQSPARVPAVDFRALKGAEAIAEGLETHLLLPLSDHPAVRKYGLRPKRGILIYGPPGTGKTTVGRILANRLKGRFFLIDGTLIPHSADYYTTIQEVFESAREAAPAVVFVDDSDSLFAARSARVDIGLSRYLLTEMDGLQADPSRPVCVVMTAADVRQLPPALVRSGRLELWIEMKVPDLRARREILLDRLAGTPIRLAPEELERVVTATEAFSCADLDRLVWDVRDLVCRAEIAAAGVLAPGAAAACFQRAILDLQESRHQIVVRPEADPSDPVEPALP